MSVALVGTGMLLLAVPVVRLLPLGITTSKRQKKTSHVLLERFPVEQPTLLAACNVKEASSAHSVVDSATFVRLVRSPTRTIRSVRTV